MDTNARLLTLKVETTEGTDAVPVVTTNAFLVTSLSYNNKLNNQQYNYIRQYYGASKTLVGSDYGMIEFAVPLQGSGTAGTAPAVGAALQLAAMLEATLAGPARNTYSLTTKGEKSGSAYVYFDGDLYKVLGGKGNAQLRFPNGQVPEARFSMIGLRQPEGSAALPGATFTAWKDPAVITKANTTFSFAGQALALESLEIDLGHNFQYINRPNTERVDFTGRNMTGRLSFEKLPIATVNMYQLARNATLSALSLANGLTAGNRVKFDSARVQLGEITESDSNGVAMMNAPLIFVPSDAGNDEGLLTFD